MTNTINLTQKIKKQLPAELESFLESAGATARKLEQDLYLAGGVVRDLLLERPNLDLDLVTEGDAIRLANELVKLNNGNLVTHTRFNTAKVRWENWSVDIATARAESYEKPGALPNCQPSDLQHDLIRRDFTINAMAICLSPLRYGELIDLYKGQEDLEHRYIRTLHDNSFKDDATRIWRAIRYEQRLDFRIEPHTLELVRRDITYLDTISGDRIRHELELALKEEKPDKVLLRASELGLLSRILPSMKVDDWLVRKIARARGIMQPYCPPEGLYLAFLIYRLTPDELDKFTSSLNYSKEITQSLHDTLELKKDLPGLADANVTPSAIYQCLHRYTQTAILTNLMVTDSPAIRERIDLFLNKLRYIQTSLKGDDLIELGLNEGPRMKKILQTLLTARLDGKVGTREEEIEMVNKMSKETQ